MEFLWLMWIIGFMTGSISSYLGCVLFCRRILKEEVELMDYLRRKQ